jgi:hypothetical protein
MQYQNNIQFFRNRYSKITPKAILLIMCDIKGEVILKMKMDAGLARRSFRVGGKRYTNI